MTAARRKLLDAAKAQNMRPADLDRAIEANLIGLREKKDDARADALKDRILDAMIAKVAPYDHPLRRRRTKAA